MADDSALFFLDTNVLAYCFDDQDAAKREVASVYVRQALVSQRGMISCQVVQEFLNLAFRKFARPFNVSEAREYYQTVLLPLCRHWPSASVYDQALLVKAETGFGWYDALILAAAIESGCDVLLTEDLNHGQVVRGVTIRDPFRT